MGSGHVRPPHIKIRALVPWTTQVRGIRAANPGGLACGHNFSEAGLLSLPLPSVPPRGQGQPPCSQEEQVG